MNKKINIHEADHHELKVYCAKASIQMNIFVQEAIQEKMEREPIVQQ